MKTLLHALHVAKGDEGGRPCSLFALAAITFGGGTIAASVLALAMAIGAGR